MAVGKSEFGGGAGIVQPEQIGHETFQQQTMEVYATNPGDPKALDGSEDPANAPDRIGLPLETYTLGR
jgi:hypothetical protein